MKQKLKLICSKIIMDELLDPNSMTPLSWILATMDLFHIIDDMTDAEAEFYVQAYYTDFI